MKEEFDHKTASEVDILSLLAELEHARRHCVIALKTAPETKRIELIVLANRYEQLRRKLQRKYFPDVDDWGWCIIKASARTMQLAEETFTSDVDSLLEIFNLIDETILAVTGKDISGCKACKDDREAV